LGKKTRESTIKNIIKKVTYYFKTAARNIEEKDAILQLKLFYIKENGVVLTILANSSLIENNVIIQ